MRKVRREDIVDFVTYSETREKIRSQVMAVKAPRRVHLGDCFTFLFENRETVRYQVQEMMRAERIVREADIQHELDTYNGLLGGPGELGCTLLIEIEKPELRDQKLRAWRELPKHVYVGFGEGRRVYATYDASQVGDERLSSVQYLKFDCKGQTPCLVGVDHEAVRVECALSKEQENALTLDLKD